MGKIRVSALGDQDAEKKQKEAAAKRRLAKKQAKGEIAAESVTPEKKEAKKESKNSANAHASKDTQGTKDSKKEEKKIETKKETKKTEGTPKKRVPHVRGKRYKNLRTLVDPRKVYPLAEGLTLVKQTSTTKFTGTIEAHFNLNRVVKVKNADGVKVERKTPLAHAKIGKTTDTETVLKTKLEQITKVLGVPNIKKVVLNASMGPGIKVSL